MITRDYKGTKLSALGMGNMRLPIKHGGSDGDIDFDRGREIIDKAMAEGVNYYDTAYVYPAESPRAF